MVVSSQTNSVTPLFYSTYFSKIRLYMIYSNLKNISLFNFANAGLVHYYSQILDVSPEPYGRSICPLFHWFHFYGNFKTFYFDIVLLS